MDVTGLADPYVKIYLLYNGQRIAKKKTHVKKRTLSPVFNESFAFDIPIAEVKYQFSKFGIFRIFCIRKLMSSVNYIQGTGACLDNISLELMLLDWDRVTKNEVNPVFFIVLFIHGTPVEPLFKIMSNPSFFLIFYLDRSLAGLNWVVHVVLEPHKIIGTRCAIHHDGKLPNGTNSPIKKKKNPPR